MQLVSNMATRGTFLATMFGFFLITLSRAPSGYSHVFRWIPGVPFLSLNFTEPINDVRI
jgi:hypothetical protein